MMCLNLLPLEPPYWFDCLPKRRISCVNIIVTSANPEPHFLERPLNRALISVHFQNEDVTMELPGRFPR
jgi:hypothetical protein